MTTTPVNAGEKIRDQILAAAPGTALELSKRLGIARGRTIHHVGILRGRQGAQGLRVVGKSPSPNGGRPVDVFGRADTTSCWVAPPRLSVDTPYRSHWIGGHPPHYPPAMTQ